MPTKAEKDRRDANLSEHWTALREEAAAAGFRKPTDVELSVNPSFYENALRAHIASAPRPSRSDAEARAEWEREFRERFGGSPV